MPPAIANLKEIAAKTFDEYRIGYRTIDTYATPRRLSLIIAGVEPAQRDSVREVFGPSKKVAFDEQRQSLKGSDWIRTIRRDKGL